MQMGQQMLIMRNVLENHQHPQESKRITNYLRPVIDMSGLASFRPTVVSPVWQTLKNVGNSKLQLKKGRCTK